ncbi:Inhibitor of growth protein 3 [Ceratobasidium sp. 392]|nr:Inhibitor of growth protein 3 [Ceratobasidium sp. 392]
MAYAPHGDPDPSRWQRELEQLTYMNHQLRRELEDTRAALQDATKDAAAAREESADLKHKIELFWDNIEDARATFVRSFPNYASYRESHKRSREADERDRLSRKSQRTESHSATASGSGPPVAPGPPRDARRSRHDYPPEGTYPPSHESQYRTHPRGQPHLTVPAGPSDKHAHPNGRSPYDTHPPAPFPDPAHPHVDGPRGPSISPHLATRIPSHQGHRHAPSDPNAYPPPDAQGYSAHARRESTDAIPIPRQRRPANAEQTVSRSSPSPSAPPQHVLDNNPNRPALPPAGAIIIHPPAAFQVSFADLQPGIFLDRADFGAEYPPNLDPPQGLQAVRCLFCDKHYSGANARSLWRRHVMGKHDFTMKGQRASTVRNRHMPQPGSLSTNGESAEPAPPGSVPSASPVQPQVHASSRSFETRPPASQRAASPGRKLPNRASGEADQLESEDDQEAFDYQRHRGGSSRTEPRKAPEAGSSGANGHTSGAGSPLTHAALENWNKGPGGSSGGDVAKWQGQGSVPGKSQGQGQAPPRRDDGERVDGTPDGGAGKDKQREWCLCRRADSWGEMVRCDMPTCAIQWYHARCVGLDVNQIQAKDEWFCEDCSRKTAQRRQEAHRDGPHPQEKDRTPALRTDQSPLQAPAQPPSKETSRPDSRDQNGREQDEDVDMQPAEHAGGDADAASNASDTEPIRAGGSSVPRKINVRRVLSESQSPKPTGEGPADARSEPPSARTPSVPLPGEGVRRSEPPDQNRSTTGSPQRKKGWKGYALVPVPDANESTLRSEHAAQVVTTPGGTRRTRSGKTYLAEDGVSASGSERQQSMETN